MWAIPGGSVRLGESLREAAEREIFEETGITIRALEPVFTFDVIDRDASGNIRFHYVIIDLTAEYVEGMPVAADDASAAGWISANELSSIEVNAKTRKLLQSRFDFG